MVCKSCLNLDKNQPYTICIQISAKNVSMSSSVIATISKSYKFLHPDRHFTYKCDKPNTSKFHNN